MEKKAVLVFDAAQRSALAVTRSLGRRADVILYTCDSQPEALAGHSKYSHEYLNCPEPAKHTGAFIQWLASIIREKQIDFLLPVTEVTSRTVLEHLNELPAVKMPFASLEKVLALSDKNKLTARAASLQIPVPQSQYYNTVSEVEPAALTFPCVLKPALSKVQLGDGWLATQVHILKSRSEFDKVASEAPYLQHPFMIQQYIEGHGAGIFCYYQHGQPKAFFAHKRLREKPPSGGVSVLSESAPVDPAMKHYAHQLMSDVGWHGAAMIEFRIAKDGTPYLMEVNTRLWGSLQLAIDAGVDFPALLLDGEYTALNEQNTFEEGVQLRWLLGDVDNLYINLRDANSMSKRIGHLKTFLTPKLRRRRHEINRTDDLGPFWYEVKRYLG